MRLHRNSNGMIDYGINLVQRIICRCLFSVSRGLDNTSSAFVSDTYIHTTYRDIDNFHTLYWEKYKRWSLLGPQVFRSRPKLCII